MTGPTPPHPRPRNYTRARHAFEQLQRALTSSGWPARLALRLGGPSRVAVEDVRIDLASYRGPPMRMAFAADFHAGPTTHPALLEDACAALAAARADVLLLGGDFVTLEARHVDALAERLGDVPAPHGRYAVLGNHDLWVDFRHVERRLEAAGIEVLTNRSARLAAPFDGVWVCGLDDHVYGWPDAAGALAGADGVRVVLMHQPSGLLDLGDARWDVALCGHTHGGQVALPGGVALVVPEGRLSRRYARGVHQTADGRTLIVSRGVGCSTIPFRAFSPPDVVVCTLAGSLESPPDGAPASP